MLKHQFFALQTFVTSLCGLKRAIHNRQIGGFTLCN